MSRASISAKVLMLAGLAAAAAWAIPAFPGAEGWGAETPGGRGGKVLIVSNTNASGAGSFMAALMTRGPRIIVFRTSGVIRLSPIDGFEPNGDFSHVTIAGQTSPGGITFTGSMHPEGSIYWCYTKCQANNFNNGVFRFLRFRAVETNQDAFSLTYSHNFIIDHCDFSGGSDETQDLTHDSAFTVQWSTIANSSVCESCQTYGSLISYNPTSKVTLHHNLWAHHVNRAPNMHWTDTRSPPNNGMIDYRNNLIYNVGIPFWLMAEGPALISPLYMNTVGNYYKTGPQGLAGTGFLKITSDATIYGADNILENESGAKAPSGSSDQSQPFAMPRVTTQGGAQAYESVTAKVGAWPRDPMSVRTIGEVRSRGGAYGKTNDALVTTGANPPADADLDGMPDFWETAMKLNPNSGDDASGDLDKDGYTNVEEYINDLALARLCESYHNPVYPIPSGWVDYNPDCSSPTGIHGGAGDSRDGRRLKLSHTVLGGGGFLVELAGEGGEPTGSVRLIDTRGRVRAEQAARTMVAFDGKDASGSPLAPGAYLVQWKPARGAAVQASLLVSR